MNNTDYPISRDVKKLCSDPKALIELALVMLFWCAIGLPVVAAACIFGALVQVDAEDDPHVPRGSFGWFLVMAVIGLFVMAMPADARTCYFYPPNVTYCYP